jgi:hypothetical protein
VDVSKLKGGVCSDGAIDVEIKLLDESSMNAGLKSVTNCALRGVLERVTQMKDEDEFNAKTLSNYFQIIYGLSADTPKLNGPSPFEKDFDLENDVAGVMKKDNMNSPYAKEVLRLVTLFSLANAMSGKKQGTFSYSKDANSVKIHLDEASPGDIYTAGKTFCGVDSVKDDDAGKHTVNWIVAKLKETGDNADFDAVEMKLCENQDNASFAFKDILDLESCAELKTLMDGKIIKFTTDDDGDALLKDVKGEYGTLTVINTVKKTKSPEDPKSDGNGVDPSPQPAPAARTPSADKQSRKGDPERSAPKDQSSKQKKGLPDPQPETKPSTDEGASSGSQDPHSTEPKPVSMFGTSVSGLPPSAQSTSSDPAVAMAQPVASPNKEQRGSSSAPPAKDDGKDNGTKDGTKKTESFMDIASKFVTENKVAVAGTGILAVGAASWALSGGSGVTTPTAAKSAQKHGNKSTSTHKHVKAKQTKIQRSRA